MNDEYCDCSDCSDEYGTTASKSPQFWCLNKGRKAIQLSPSRINDGICGIFLNNF